MRYVTQGLCHTGAAAPTGHPQTFWGVNTANVLSVCLPVCLQEGEEEADEENDPDYDPKVGNN